MQLTAKNLPLSEITATTFTKDGNTVKGFKVCGVWLKGSPMFDSAEELHKFLMGKELCPASEKGSALAVVGGIQTVKTDLLRNLLVERDPSVSYVPVNLNDLL